MRGGPRGAHVRPVFGCTRHAMLRSVGLPPGGKLLRPHVMAVTVPSSSPRKRSIPEPMRERRLLCARHNPVVAGAPARAGDDTRRRSNLRGTTLALELFGER